MKKLKRAQVQYQMAQVIFGKIIVRHIKGSETSTMHSFL